jgi:hypothetical protein
MDFLYRAAPTKTAEAADNRLFGYMPNAEKPCWSSEPACEFRFPSEQFGHKAVQEKIGGKVANSRFCAHLEPGTDGSVKNAFHNGYSSGARHFFIAGKTLPIPLRGCVMPKITSSAQGISHADRGGSARIEVCRPVRHRNAVVLLVVRTLYSIDSNWYIGHISVDFEAGRSSNNPSPLPEMDIVLVRANR